MRISPRLLLAFLLASIGLLATTPLRADQTDINAAARSVVRVVLIAEGSDGDIALVSHGTGFAVGPDLVLTNAHVVEDATRLRNMRIGVVPSQGSGGWFARVVMLARGKDLALLKLTEKGALPPATLFTGPVEDGAEVHAIGYPGSVDLAQGLTIGDIVSPTSPVKTRGSIAGNRSARQVDTILHTAPIGGGNSGGPLLDSCGRVIGVNSFGTISEGSDSEFYFAVSMREVMRFLTAAGVQPQATGIACRSIAELDRAENERLASEKANGERAAQALAEQRDARLRAAHERAQFDVLGEREDGMALAGLALILALGAGGMAWQFSQREGQRERQRYATVGAVVLVGLACWAWLSRPGFDEIEDRAAAFAKEASASGKPGRDNPAGEPLTGPLVCVLDPAKSRVTVSAATDVALDWQADGCVNDRSQYGLGPGGWQRVLVPNQEDTVTVASFDPESATYRTERYLLGLDLMQKLRKKRAGYKAPACDQGAEAARDLGEQQAGIIADLPPAPNERLVYRCQRASATTP